MNYSMLKFLLTILLACVLLLALLPYSALSLSPASKIENFDARSYAFITKGIQGAVNWINTGNPSIWDRCKGGSVGNITLNHFSTSNLHNTTNRIFMEIRVRDNVYIRTLRLQKNLFLVICGSSTLGKLVLADSEMTSLNQVNIVSCPGGSFTLDILAAQNNVALNLNIEEYLR